MAHDNKNRKRHAVPKIMIDLYEQGRLNVVQAVCGKIWAPTVIGSDAELEDRESCKKCLHHVLAI